jgi:hypothetical protein
VFRDVFVNLLAAGVLAGLGWGAYKAVGLFGVQYKDLTGPWASARTSYYDIDNALYSVKPTRYQNAVETEKLKSTSEQLHTNLTAFSANNQALAAQKAAKKGKLTKELKSYQTKSAAYSTYVKNRLASAEILAPTLVVCDKSYTGVDSATLLGAITACQESLSRVNTATLTDPSIAAFMTDLKTTLETYKAAVTTLDQTPASDQKAINTNSSKVFAQRREIDDLYTRVGAELDQARQKIGMDRAVKDINSKLADLTN